MFQLTKWYLDVVTDRGEALIAYSARLKIAGISLRYASVLVSRPNMADYEQTSIRPFTWPVMTNGTCGWHHKGLAFDGQWSGPSPSIMSTLLDGRSGEIVWNCHLPRARAKVRFGEYEFKGSGYVECIRLSVAPWKLPFRTLHWGRHISDQHSLVWIAWDDGLNRRWSWLDGEERSGARLAPSGLVGLDDTCELQWRDSRDVRNRNVMSGITRVLPVAKRHFRDSLAAMHEHKQLSRSSLVVAGRALDHGWSIHEIVTW